MSEEFGVADEQVNTRSTVLIVGMGAELGSRIARRLHRSRQVLGLGLGKAVALPIDVEHLAIDPLRSAARPIFARRDIGAIIYVDDRDERNESREERHSRSLLSFQKVLEYAELNGIGKVILLSSASNYGPRPGNAQYLDEAAPLLAGANYTEMHASVELDMYAQSCFWRSPNIELVILRPVNVLGTLDNGPSNYLRLPVVTTLMGFDPMIQLVHQDDVAVAVELALKSGVRGVFNLAGPPPVSLAKALSLLGRRTMSLPYSIAKGGLSGLFRIGLSKFVSPELDFLRYICMVDDTAARRTLGYLPAYDLESTLHSVDDERWVAR